MEDYDEISYGMDITQAMIFKFDVEGNNKNGFLGTKGNQHWKCPSI